jgi:hypothetical protein
MLEYARAQLKPVVVVLQTRSTFAPAVAANARLATTTEAACKWIRIASLQREETRSPRPLETRDLFLVSRVPYKAGMRSVKAGFRGVEPARGVRYDGALC